jgi:hypothetical protein
MDFRIWSASRCIGVGPSLQARDVRGVLRGSSGRIDWQYLRRWAAHLGIDDLLERFANPSP